MYCLHLVCDFNCPSGVRVHCTCIYMVQYLLQNTVFCESSYRPYIDLLNHTFKNKSSLGSVEEWKKKVIIIITPSILFTLCFFLNLIKTIFLGSVAPLVLKTWIFSYNIAYNCVCWMKDKAWIMYNNTCSFIPSAFYILAVWYL